MSLTVLKVTREEEERIHFTVLFWNILYKRYDQSMN